MSSDKNCGSLEKKDLGVLESLHLFIDSNLKMYQNALYITGGVGIIIIVRSLYLTKVFTKVQDIPAHWIQKRVKLRGKVKEVSDEGVLEIEHIPFLRTLMPFAEKKVPECLPVHLACIDLSPEGRLWLSNKVLDKVVKFRLLHRTGFHDGTGSHNGIGPHLYSKVEIPMRFRRNLQVNEELIRLGLSKISTLSSLEENGKLPTNQNLLLYLDRLVKLEEQASRKGVGMWKQPKEGSWTKTGLTGFINIVTGPVKLMKWLYNKWKQKK